MRVLILLCLAACAGCSSTDGFRRLPDGSVLEIHNTRVIWASEGIDFGVTDTNGFTAKLSIQKSSPDAQTAQAIARGVAEGMTSAAAK